MVDIYPFQGVRYNPGKITGYESVTAPPYDVITSEEQEELYRRDPYNIVRLILGLRKPDDNEEENVYRRSHQTLESWRSEGILKSDEKSAIYAYAQSWEGMERRGFIAKLLLENYETGKVLPHEYTLGGPKADRLILMKATGSVLSPIFCLYHDSSKEIEKRLFIKTLSTTEIQPIEVLDKDQVLHRFWPVTDSSDIAAIQSLLKEKRVFIADGHHRYETALSYRDWRRGKQQSSGNNQENTPPGSLPWDFTMAFFTNMADEGLKIYPTHRLLTSLPEGWTREKLLKSMMEYFELSPSKKNTLFKVQTEKGEEESYQLKPGVDLSEIPSPLRSLDVALLDHFLFKRILKLSANELKQRGYLQFVRDEAEIASLIESDNPSLLVIRVHAPDVEQVREICESGLRMPQKSTYFYPKLLSGLVLYYYGPDTLFS